MFRYGYRVKRTIGCFLVVAAAGCWQSAAAQDQQLADEILKSVSRQNALCVVLGCEDGELAVPLSRSGKFLVHALCTSENAVERSRESIANAQLRGIVSAETGSMARLPYSDNIVNLVVAENIDALLRDGLTVSEVLRVLRPGGVAWLGRRAADKEAQKANRLQEILVKAGIKSPEVIENHGVWVRLVKPRPTSMDDWTHKRGDASGNPVSADKQIGVPTGVRWVAGPNWPTGDRKASVPTVVASHDQLINVIEDEVSSSEGAKRENSLIARDAFNGLRLWRRRADSLKVVALADRIYTTVDGKLVSLDSETGEVARTFDIDVAGEFFFSDGLLVVAGSKGITAVDHASGETRWSNEQKPKDMRAGDGRLFIHIDRSRRGGDSQLICFDLQTGEQMWAVSTKAWAKKDTLDLIFYKNGVLVTASKRGNHAISAKDGSHLWDYTYPRIGHGGSFAKVMSAKGLIWVHTANSQGSGQYAWEGLDPQSGEMKKRLLQPKSFQYKHRCSFDVGTGNVLLCGSMAFANLETGAYSRFEAARTSCRTAGLVPANGLVYTFPHACGCYTMLRGFLAMETNPSAGSPLPIATDRLEKGPSYETDTSDSKAARSDWPTYRHDVSRSGSTSAAGPTELTKLWQQVVADPVPTSVELEWDQKDGGRLSSPVVAEGLAFFADSNHHRISALDAETGKPRWSFTTGGRIDCPPSIHNGRCLFGSHDGYVYCVAANSGKLCWRLRAAPHNRRIVAYGQLEAVRPVVGGVLVFDDLAYFLTGRHSAADGGILVQAVEPKTGKVIWAEQVEGHNGVPDVLTGGNGTIQMASWEVDAKTGKKRSSGVGRLRGGRLGLLNDAWYKRPIAMRKNLQQWTIDDRPTGQMLAFRNSVTCGYQACEKVSGSNGKMSGNAQLFAKLADGENWSIAMPSDARLYGMVLAGERLYVAGRFYRDEKDDAGVNGVQIYNVADGKLLAEQPIDDKFIHDCLAVAGGRLYVSTQGGRLICLGTK